MEQKFEEIKTDELDEAGVNAMIAELQGATPLSRLSFAEARAVFERMAKRGYLIGKAL